QPDHGSFRELTAKQVKRLARSTAKHVDRLVGIADHKNVGACSVCLCFRTRQQPKDFHLREVRILKFVDQQKSDVAALFFKQHGIVLEQIVRAGNHVAECAQV